LVSDTILMTNFTSFQVKVWLGFYVDLLLSLRVGFFNLVCVGLTVILVFVRRLMTTQVL